MPTMLVELQMMEQSTELRSVLCHSKSQPEWLPLPPEEVAESTEIARGTVTPFRRAPVYDFEMGACLHPERRLHRTAVEICNRIHMLAAEHAHHRDLFLQICVAEH